MRGRSPSGGMPAAAAHGGQQRGQVFDVTAAEIQQVLIGESTQPSLQGLHPQPERGGGAQGIGASGKGEHRVLLAGDELGGQPGLAYAGVAEEKGDPQMVGGRLVDLGGQPAELGLPADEMHPAPFTRAGLGRLPTGPVGAGRLPVGGGPSLRVVAWNVLPHRCHLTRVGVTSLCHSMAHC